MRYLITGAGTVGLAIGAKLLPDHQVVFFDAVKRPFLSGARQVAGDLSDLDALTKASEGADGVFHTAALHGVHAQTHTSSQFMSTNVVGTFNVFEAALKAGVRRVIFSSTVGVYGQGQQRPDGSQVMPGEDAPRLPTDYYGLSKLLAEDIGAFYRHRSIFTVALRYGAVRQTLKQFFGKLDLRPVLMGMVVDADDCATANLRAMAIDHDPPRWAYNILPPSVVNQVELLSAGGLRAALARKFPDLADRLPADLPPFTVRPEPQVVKDLGFEFEHSPEEFLREALGALG